MADHDAPPRAPINLQAQGAHRRQTFWQVYFPLLLAAAFFGFLLYLLLTSSNEGSLQSAAEISVIVLAIPVLFVGLFLGAAAVMLSFGVGRAIHWLPPQTAKLQKIARDANQAVKRGAKGLHRIASVFDNVESSIDQLFGRGQDE